MLVSASEPECLLFTLPDELIYRIALFVPRNRNINSNSLLKCSLSCKLLYQVLCPLLLSKISLKLTASENFQYNYRTFVDLCTANAKFGERTKEHTQHFTAALLYEPENPESLTLFGFRNLLSLDLTFSVHGYTAPDLSKEVDYTVNHIVFPHVVELIGMQYNGLRTLNLRNLQFCVEMLASLSVALGKLKSTLIEFRLFFATIKRKLVLVKDSIQEIKRFTSTLSKLDKLQVLDLENYQGGQEDSPLIWLFNALKDAKSLKVLQIIKLALSNDSILALNELLENSSLQTLRLKFVRFPIGVVETVKLPNSLVEYSLEYLTCTQSTLTALFHESNVLPKHLRIYCYNSNLNDVTADPNFPVQTKYLKTLKLSSYNNTSQLFPHILRGLIMCESLRDLTCDASINDSRTVAAMCDFVRNSKSLQNLSFAPKLSDSTRPYLVALFEAIRDSTTLQTFHFQFFDSSNDYDLRPLLEDILRHNSRLQSLELNCDIFAFSLIQSVKSNPSSQIRRVVFQYGPNEVCTRFTASGVNIHFIGTISKKIAEEVFYQWRKGNLFIDRIVVDQVPDEALKTLVNFQMSLSDSSLELGFKDGEQCFTYNPAKLEE
ncbi:hypothetical protein HK098_007889 [Nowakowskiella sp. JEL0407]|nr:hypothetical protein HK098_007889 [Nowakowskiella sp. JEL0407]